MESEQVEGINLPVWLSIRMRLANSVIKQEKTITMSVTGELLCQVSLKEGTRRWRQKEVMVAQPPLSEKGRNRIEIIRRIAKKQYTSEGIKEEKAGETWFFDKINISLDGQENCCCYPK